jgi:hypothetical protein
VVIGTAVVVVALGAGAVVLDEGKVTPDEEASVGNDAEEEETTFPGSTITNPFVNASRTILLGSIAVLLLQNSQVNCTEPCCTTSTVTSSSVGVKITPLSRALRLPICSLYQYIIFHSQSEKGKYLLRELEDNFSRLGNLVSFLADTTCSVQSFQRR